MHAEKSFIIKIYGKKIWNEYFKFTFIRNPWDRMVSNYFYQIQKGYDIPDSFKEWAIKIGFNFIDRIPLRDQYSWVYENGISSFDFVGKFENLDEDFKYICQKIGKEEGCCLPHVNKSTHGHYSQYFDEELLKISNTFFSRDIAAFNYRFKKQWI